MQRSPEFHQDCFQFELIKAPLATFDTIDLGDDLPPTAICPSVAPKGQKTELARGHNSAVRSARSIQQCVRFDNPTIRAQHLLMRKEAHLEKETCSKYEVLKEENTKVTAAEKSKESSSDIGRKLVQQLAVDHHSYHEYEKESPNYVYLRHTHIGDNQLHLESPVNLKGASSAESNYDSAGKVVDVVPNPVPKIEGVKISQLSRTDSFSSSSSDSESDICFRTIQVRHSQKAKVRDCTDSPTSREQSSVTLSPELIDPTTITSPSKRKAYEKRLLRLQVKTSPIARPRSTTPINVVTLDEYVVLSSPEKSPNSPSIAEKLKITLPPDEFCTKPRSPRKSPFVKETKDEPVFEFNEELLFSHTKSALLIDEYGNLPPSPRRVLIPPTISPSSSPKLAPVTKLQHVELEGVPGSPKLVYFQSNKLVEEENWATFPKEPEDVDVDQTDSKLKDDESTEHPQKPAYAKEDISEAQDDEEVLTINIERTDGSKKCDIVLSSSGSSNLPSPSSPVNGTLGQSPQGTPAFTTVTDSSQQRSSTSSKEESVIEADPKRSPTPISETIL